LEKSFRSPNKAPRPDQIGKTVQVAEESAPTGSNWKIVQVAEESALTGSNWKIVQVAEESAPTG
jgi:hypothetical protein